MYMTSIPTTSRGVALSIYKEHNLATMWGLKPSLCNLICPTIMPSDAAWAMQPKLMKHLVLKQVDRIRDISKAYRYDLTQDSVYTPSP